MCIVRLVSKKKISKISTTTAPHLREFRQAKLLTQSELALVADVSEFTISRAENGEPVSFSTLRKLAAALGCERLALVMARGAEGGDSVVDSS
jgi:transcriptional regulator with XRE-family HTH domain